MSFMADQHNFSPLRNTTAWILRKLRIIMKTYQVCKVIYNFLANNKLKIKKNPITNAHKLSASYQKQEPLSQK